MTAALLTPGVCLSACVRNIGNQLHKVYGSMTHIVNITPQLHNHKEVPVSRYSKHTLKGKTLSGLTADLPATLADLCGAVSMMPSVSAMGWPRYGKERCSMSGCKPPLPSPVPPQD